MTGPSELTLFFGRLHPLLVHLPIGFIVLLAFLEILARSPRFRQANANAGLILAIAVPAAFFAVLCGWFLSLGGGYQEGLLSWHKWTGITTAAICLLAGLLYSLDLKKLYRWCLFSSVLVLAVTSHFGGSLTHGSDYLVRYAPAPLRELFGGQKPAPVAKPATIEKEPGQTAVFAGIVRPVFDENCVSCHGPEKSKGKLRLDSLAAILKGGEAGIAVTPGKAAESPLVKRLLLPLSDNDHMPPDGKPQPSPEDISLIQWWIQSGAPADKTVAELKPPPNIARILASRIGGAAEPVAKIVPPRPLNDVLPLATTLADQLDIAVTALSPTEPWLQCNASVTGTNFGDAELTKLMPLAANLRWLDLAGTRITDGSLTNLASMPNLVRLHLERTAVTDAGLPQLAGLANLEYLNLYGTTITDQGLEQLQTLPKLKQLYLWQTKVTSNAASAFTEARTDRDQIQRWQDEIEQLKARIRDAHVSVDLGTVVASATAPSTNAAPINAECPVSGKPIDTAKTILHEGKLVAFCCDDCKAKFEQDPKPFLAKLNLSAATQDSAAGKAQ